MKLNYKFFLPSFITLCLVFLSCSKELTNANINPNGVSPETGNPNLTMPTVMSGAAKSYMDMGFGKISGVMQHTQEDGWYSGFNFYDWSPDEWSGWYGLLRNNQFVYDRAVTLDYKFHQGVALTMKSFMFGVITDLWGDAPYTNALKAGSEESILFPEYDSQETIYKGIIEDLKTASSLFAGAGDISNSYADGYDIYFNGDVEKWQKFTNSLLLRYYLRVSDKLPEIAKAGVEGIYASGVYMKEPDDDAVMEYIGSTQDNSWPQTPIQFDASQSNWRRRKAAAALMDKLNTYNDPRRALWFQPVHVQWVADPTLPTSKDQYIRKNGVLLNGVESYDDQEFQELIVPGVKFTRRYNPNTYTPNPPYTFGTIDANEYVGIKAGYNYPDFYNENPTPGQNVQNQHVSQLSNLFKQSSGDLLKAKLMTSAETSFILAEAAQKGWSAGSAETHYEKGVENSLAAWGLEDEYSDYIIQTGVAFAGTQEQIIEQKWIASFTSTLEAWFDFRRTGLPALVAGTASPAPVLPVRLIYGDNELNYNTENANSGIERNETNTNVGPRGKNSQWAKPWIIQGTGKPW